MKTIADIEGIGYRVVAKANKTGEIWIYGTVGVDWFGEGVTAKQFSNDLRALGAVDQIDVRINSEGGVVADGRAIYNLLVENKAKVITHVDGQAASIASVIALAGDEIVIAEGGIFMIHNPHVIMRGDAAELRHAATALDMIRGTILDTYVARTNKPRATIQKWMDEETWFSGKEAVEHGFADRITEDLRVSMCVRRPERFKAVPAALTRPNTDAARAMVAARSR